MEKRKINLTPFYRGFTLIEAIIACSIFLVIMGIVLVLITGSFRSLRTAQTILSKEQRQRFCLYRLSREVSSFARIVFPQVRFKGEQEGFFLSLPQRTT